MEKRKNGRLWGAEPVLEPSRTHLDPVVKLACAVLKRAAIDAKAGDLGAAAWLASDLSYSFFKVMGFDHELAKEIAAQWLKNPSGRILIRLIPGG
jgi:hypothetical protein